MKFSSTLWHILCVSSVFLALNDANELPNKSFFVDEIFLKYSNASSNFSHIGIEALESIMNELNIKTGNQIANSRTDVNLTKCFTIEDLLEIYEVQNGSIGQDEFSEMSVAIMWMAITDPCHEHDKESESESNKPGPIKYLFGTIIMVLTWLLSFISVVIIDKLHKGQDNLIMALRALAVGTLLGDALIHLVPATLGFHSDPATVLLRDKRDPIWKMSAIVATLLGLWLFESFMHQSHNHSHDHDVSEKTPESNESSSEKNVDPINTIELNNTEKTTTAIVKTNTNTAKSLKNIHPNGWIAFIGDIIHKIADGLAIGAAFSDSLGLGFSTSIALFFHEIPHELGEYAVLTGSGFKFYTILLLNGTTSLISLVTFFLISLVTSNDASREWMFTVTIGVFLYLSLVNMLPQLKQYFEKNKDQNKWRPFLMVIASFLSGWILLWVIAVFEDDIRIDL